MGSQSNPITPHETWLELFWSNSIELCIFAGCISISFYRLYSIKSFSGRFIFLHLRTSPRSDFPGSHGAKKHTTDLFCFEHAHFKVFIFYVSFHGVYLATSPKRLETELTNITRRHFCSLPFFVLNILLFTLFSFSYRTFCPLFVCFDILWQLATTHARDNTRDREANSLRQNDVTWCDFLQGKQVELLLSRSLLPQKT